MTEPEENEELEDLRKENTNLKTKLQWLEEKLKNVSDNNSLVTETLNELHSRLHVLTLPMVLFE